jgi:arylsulfatase A-like enzyme
MSRLNRRTALKTLAGFPALLSAQSRRPNVLFIITDDQRWDAMSCAGNKILKTPNMDRLAQGGVRFSQAFATNPLCSPSRACSITGLYSHAHGVTTNSGPSHYFKPNTVTYPMLLQKAGYHTAMLGKWHIASSPADAGFDHWCILPGQGVYHDPVMVANGGRIQLRGYVDDLIADQAIETLKSRPKDKPFSVICNFKAPHRAWQPAARFEKTYDDIAIPEPPTFNTSLDDRPAGIRNTDMQVADMPDFANRGVPAALPRELRKHLNYQLFIKNYYRTILGVDENLGRILDYLDNQRLAENTLIIFMGDNGFFLGEYGMFDKRLMYEPSIRIPMLARYPNGWAAGRVDSNHMVLNNDVAHTILDYCGVERPAHMRNHGESWRPILDGRASAPWRDSWLYENFEYPGPHCAPKARGVRTSRYKLVQYIQQPVGHEFFDLDKDPEERRSVYDDPAYKTQVAQLTKELDRLRTVTADDRAEDGLPAPQCVDRMARPR